jgi:putative Holliday junction resolvase
MTRLLGLDIGDRKIGVALSDPEAILASPLNIIERQGDLEDVKAILDIIQREQVSTIIVGLPRSMDGSIGGQAKKVMTFTSELKVRTGVPIEYRDERLSTVLANRLMRERKIKKKARQKTGDDATAAAIVLQGYLDEVRYSG